MAFKDTGSLQSLLGDALQMRPRPSEEDRIDGGDLKERVFPFNQPIERRACALRHMKKDQRLRGVRDCHHEKANGTFLMPNGTLFMLWSQRNLSVRDAKGRAWRDDA